MFLREAGKVSIAEPGSVQRKGMTATSEPIWRTSNGQQHGAATAGVIMVGAGTVIRTQLSSLPIAFNLLRVLHYPKEGKSLKHDRFHLLSIFVLGNWDIYYTKMMNQTQTCSNYTCTSAYVHKIFWENMQETAEVSCLKAVRLRI